MLSAVAEMRDPASIDILLLIGMNTAESLFLNVAQINSGSLTLALQDRAIVPTSLLYFLDHEEIIKERAAENLRSWIIQNEFSEKVLKKYAHDFMPKDAPPTEYYLPGTGRRIDIVPVVNWLQDSLKKSEEVDSMGQIDLDCPGWKLVLAKPRSHSEVGKRVPEINDHDRLNKMISAFIKMPEVATPTITPYASEIHDKYARPG